jgi:hypothetical protein
MTPVTVIQGDGPLVLGFSRTPASMFPPIFFRATDTARPDTGRYRLSMTGFP